MLNATLPTLPRRLGRRKAYLPSPEEIQAACLEIQKEWSEDERRRRAVSLTPEEAQEQYVMIRSARMAMSGTNGHSRGDAA